MHKLCEYIDEELNVLENKAGQGLTKSELEYGDMLAHFKKSLLTNKAMEESGYSDEYRGMSRGDRMYYGTRHDDDMSYGRGRTGNVRRDSMGRYSRENYSHDEAREDLMHELREFMQKAPEEERHAARNFMNVLKNA